MSSRERPIAVYAAVFANAAIAVLKFVVAAITGSASMLTEGFHSTIDTVNEALLLLGLARSRKEPDAVHPFGYGKELYFWSLIVAIGIFAAGGGIAIYEGVTHIARHDRATRVGWSYAVLGAAFVFEGCSLAMGLVQAAERRPPGKKLLRHAWDDDDPSVLTVIAEDSAALLGIVIAASGIWMSDRLDAPWIDGAASIAIGVLLAGVALLLVHKSRTLLVGEGLPLHVRKHLHATVEADPAVVRAGPPLTMRLGPGRLLVNVDVHFADGLETAEIVAAVDRIEREIRRVAPDVSHVFVEAESIRPKRAA